MFNISKNTTIYIVAPPAQASGGPELLHQLCNSLVRRGLHAVMFYFDFNRIGERYEQPVHPRFEQYDTKYVEVIEDKEENIVIVPERLTNPLTYYSKVQKCVWWLGANNYFWLEEIGENKYLRFAYHWFRYFIGKPTPLMFRQIKSQNAVHLAQSWYAVSTLINKGVYNVAYLSDYISEAFIEESKRFHIDYKSKENIIVYNPSRHTKFLKQIGKADKSLKFIPIKDMSLDEVTQTMCKAKIYIDFGSHPGKDRMPREAALCGCCIITSTLGSAGYFDDVPILSHYKFVRKKKNIKKIIQKIHQIFDFYEDYQYEFEGYRKIIMNEHNNFQNDLSKVFMVNKLLWLK